MRQVGHLWLYYNTDDGNLAKGIQAGRNWAGTDQVMFAGAMNGDSTQYVLARQTSTGNLYAYWMLPGGRLSSAGQVGRGWPQFRFILAPGNISGDAKADLMAIDRAGAMICFRSRGGGHITNVGQCGRGWNGFAHAAVPGDMDGNGRWDLISVAKLTNPNKYGDPTGMPSATPIERGPLYVYKNLGNGR